MYWIWIDLRGNYVAVYTLSVYTGHKNKHDGNMPRTEQQYHGSTKRIPAHEGKQQGGEIKDGTKAAVIKPGKQERPRGKVDV